MKQSGQTRPADKACTDSQSLSSLFVSGSNNEINRPAATLQQRCSLQYNDHALPSYSRRAE